ncbi:PTS system mannose/fructose/sorbose family transporter subunit IID [Eubacteriales bacterium OttesenSCG-928-N14]|nr:PTS system mannose/fructose/sorbose family transporter subunit IID [Eubacteriales bacterium OttesenSCG-928-N14]
MSIIQALLFAVIYWLKKVELSNYFSWWVFGRAITCGLWAGLILGNVQTGLVTGATIQLIYLGQSGAGGVIPNDEGAAALLGTAVVIQTGIDPGLGISIAVAVGLLYAQLDIVKRLINGYFARLCDKHVANCDIRGLYRVGLGYTMGMKALLFGVPMFISAYWGTELIGNIMNIMPVWLTNALTTAGGMLPAIGFAMIVTMIGRFDLLPFFIGGFLLAGYVKIGTMPMVFLALFISYIYLLIIKRDEPKEKEEKPVEQVVGDKPPMGLFTNKELTFSLIRWLLFVEICNSFDRQQGVGFCMALAPDMKKLYKDDPEELKAALENHIEFYNTCASIGSIINGIVLSMEEQRAQGVPISREAIRSVKVGLMGTLAGIHESLINGAVQPLVLLTFSNLAAEGKVWAPIAFVACMLFFVMFLESYLTFKAGYRMGSVAAIKLLQGGKMQTLLSFFQVLGMFMVGSLCFANVSMPIKIVIDTGATSVALQSVFDMLAPGLLPLTLILLLYRYYTSGAKNAMIKATLYVLAIGLVLGALGIIGK